METAPDMKAMLWKIDELLMEIQAEFAEIEVISDRLGRIKENARRHREWARQEAQALNDGDFLPPTPIGSRRPRALADAA